MRRIKVSFNSPVILTFTMICLISLALGEVTEGKTTEMFFSVYRSSLASPITYVRFAGHVFGHAGWDHFLGKYYADSGGRTAVRREIWFF